VSRRRSKLNKHRDPSVHKVVVICESLDLVECTDHSGKVCPFGVPFLVELPVGCNEVSFGNCEHRQIKAPCIKFNGIELVYP